MALIRLVRRFCDSGMDWSSSPDSLSLCDGHPELQPLICQISLAADSKSDMVSFAAASSLISGGHFERKPGQFRTVVVINQIYTAMESYHVFFLLLYFYLSVILHI